jgi:hypothetical protein
LGVLCFDDVLVVLIIYFIICFLAADAQQILIIFI